MKKIFLLLFVTLSVISQVQSKSCGCSTVGRTYSWVVANGTKCASAKGTALKITDYGSYSVKEEVDVSEGISYCGF
jgi:hypothetical protein